MATHKSEPISANAPGVFYFHGKQPWGTSVAYWSPANLGLFERNPISLDSVALLAAMADGDERTAADFHTARHHLMAPHRARFCALGRITLSLSWEMELHRSIRIAARDCFHPERLPRACFDRAGRYFVLLDAASHIRSERISLGTTP